jgi:nitrite reductase/ring-hydroxylating ferredoxin subunit
MTDFVRVASRNDIPEGRATKVKINSKEIALFNSGGRFYAINNACHHRGGPLAEGDISGTRVACPWHGWEYDFTTGKNPDDPGVSVACFPVKLEGDEIFVAA